MTIKTPVKAKHEFVTGYAYVIEGKDTILARCNSDKLAKEIVSAINDAPRLQAIDEAAKELCETSGPVHNSLGWKYRKVSAEALDALVAARETKP